METVIEAPAQDLKVRFGTGDFYPEVKRRVHAKLESVGASGHDDWRYFAKAAFIFAWFLASYLALVFVVQSWWTAVLGCISLGLAAAGIGFNVMHDGGHGACSSRPWVNRWMALSLELLGGSSFIWNWKHNIVHHTYSNILGVDDDLEVGPWARMAPHQPHRWFHRYQQFYMWALFGFLPFKWYLIDIRNYRRNGFGRHRFPDARGGDRTAFFAGKILLPIWTLVLPALFRPVPLVVAAYALSFAVVGIALSSTFLLAHCVDDAQCGPLPPSGRIDTEWAVHQVQTTVDFAPHNWLATFYLGGLNFQIEHHLFPKISHVYYPLIAPVVQQACADFGVRYSVRPTVRRALASHFRWLQRMGRGADALPA